MFLSAEVVRKSIHELSRVHPFFGTTFLVCKLGHLPIGDTVRFAINQAEERFLDQYYRPNKQSAYFFQPFRTSGANRWLSPRYPSTSSQGTRTRGLLAAAFLHGRGTDSWGWQRTYVETLRSKLDQDNVHQVPLFWLAVWLYRNQDWGDDVTPVLVIETFLRDFYISDEELLLFDTQSPMAEITWSSTPLDEKQLLRDFIPPPDAPPDEGGRLVTLTLSNIGPAKNLTLSLAERLSIITGDNGLGKTFLLECAWWALTGEWTSKVATPAQSGNESRIFFEIESSDGIISPHVAHFDRSKFRWSERTERTTIAAPVVYARVDGSFAIWDPARLAPDGNSVTSLTFSREEVFEGSSPRIEGLIRDWVRWQNAKDQTVFKNFSLALEQLSPPEAVPLRPGEPVRLYGDTRETPTIVHPYGDVPITLESAGVRRVVTLAYLLVWAANEHRIHSGILNKTPQSSVLLMIDEIEAHLHPKWQRTILPALLQVTGGMGNANRSQLLVATHSPLVLASIEGAFDPSRDRLYHLNSVGRGGVSLAEIPYFKRGSVDEWLKSPTFELKQARSREGERLLETAKALFAAPSSDEATLRAVNEQLSEVLPPEDTFWVRWRHFLARRGLLDSH